jgi:hypothetical protein
MQSLVELLARLDFFRQHVTMGGAVLLHEVCSLGGRRSLKVDFDDIGQRCEWLAQIVGYLVIQRDRVARLS